MSTGAKGQAAKSLASWVQPPQTPLDPGIGTMIPAAALRAATTSGLGDAIGEGLGLTTAVTCGLASVVADELAPQPVNANSVNTATTTPR